MLANLSIPLEGSRGEVRPGVRVLVVDDDEDAAEALATLLRLFGHEARTAYDGAAALALAGEFDPAVVLLDLDLPDTHGCAVARELRDRLGSRCPMLVALTGCVSEEAKRCTARSGFALHLLKPCEPDALDELLADPVGVARRGVG